MELQEILSVALGTLIVIVIAHFAVFWVVRTLYPPVLFVSNQQPVQQQTFTPVASIPQPEPQQDVTIPTYTPPVPVETPRKEEPPRGPPPAESTSIRGESRVDTANTRPA